MDTNTVITQLRSRIRLVKKLARERRTLAARLTKIDTQLARLGGGLVMSSGASAKPRKRARNKLSLADAMAKVVNKDKPMAVADIETAVKRSGYKSTSKTFRTIIYQTLGKDRRFRKAGRGKYCLKG